jgi:DNA-binding transcriptional ArsR family regulator
LRLDLADEETYSLIFSSLKHPIRRRILRMLHDGELTFSQILETLSIDSGHLSYHLDSLGDLITRSQDGKYRLSSFGSAAVKLMSRVEEHRTPTNSRPASKIDATVKILAAILAAVLLLASIYSITLITQTSNPFLDLPARSFASSSSHPLTFNLTLVYGNSESRMSEPNGLILVTHKPTNTAIEWTRYPLALDLEFNETYNVNVTVHDPNNDVANAGPLLGDRGTIGVGLGAYMSQPGSYLIEIESAQADWLYGNITLHVYQESFQRPLFYYGLAGITTASLSTFIILSSWLWVKKKAS